MNEHPLGNNDDVWSYASGSSKFKSSVIYRHLLEHNVIDPSFKWAWKSYCQPKHKVFCWLLLKDRLSTRNILRRKRMALGSYNCEFCSMNVEETIEHLLWYCPFAQDCWGSLNLEIMQNGDSCEIVAALKVQMNSQFFMV